MYFKTKEEQKRAEYLRDQIQAQYRNYALAIENHFRPCSDCGGTGLRNIGKLVVGGFHWDGSSFCDKCKGVGYLDWEDSDLLHICYKCLGKGRDKNWNHCSVCQGKGVLDWVQNLKGCI